jgi:hypothetical protein
MSPRSRISIAFNSSPRKNADRRGSHASVASAPIVGRTPLNFPKFDSTPQMPTIAIAHFGENFAVLVVHLPGGADDGRPQLAGDVLLERQHRFGLRPIALDDAGLRLFDGRERLIDDFRSDPPVQRVGADPGEPFRE